MSKTVLADSLILWDVDHTLIENGGVSKETYALAYELIVGQQPNVRPVTHGRTDFQIMRALLEANGQSAAAFPTISEFTGPLLDAMAIKSPELPGRGYVLTGVVAALTALSIEPNIIQSVLTGNISQNAYAKVTPFGLDEWLDLDVGGYGSDNEVRSELVDAARRKVEAKYGRRFTPESTVLIGDTPLDVKAAHDGGAKVIAVATGVHDLAELVDAGADEALLNLEDHQGFMAALARVRAMPAR
ncbi:HAD hydrolase-like protein [Alloactinosynnema sp. L-07]|uniref:HAD hydrolase-like protein n=1 Tax=Alloactinosynnema sp. L-07 TaxID=1653480 RepID=UPI00155FF42D|nr:HAD hydrolase-like protein [Alloactinosynnema sp. L-07]